jgi:ATP-binding cassette subfamily C protein
MAVGAEKGWSMMLWIGSAWQTLAAFYRRRPRQVATIVVGQILIGVLDSISFMTLLPLLYLVTTPDRGNASWIMRWVEHVFQSIGLAANVLGILTFMVAVICTKAVLAIMLANYGDLTISRFVRDFRMDLASKIVQTRWQYLLNQSAGRNANLLGSEINEYGKALQLTIGLVTRGLQVVLYFATALIVAWQITLAGSVVGLVLTMLMMPAMRSARSASRRKTKHFGAMSAYFVEVLHGIKSLKSMALELQVLPLLKRRADELVKAQRQAVLSSSFRANIPDVFIAICLAVGLYVAIELLHVPFPELAVISVLFVKTLGQLNTLNGRLHQVMALEGSVRTVTQKLNEAEREAEVFRGGIQPTLTRDLCFRNVSIAQADRPILDNVSIKFRANCLTAIIGPSGSGKTSVLDCILGFISPVAGEILIDDKPLTSVSLRDWRRMIGYVQQETFLFHDSILANLTLHNPNISKSDVVWALEAAEARQFVDAMPKGLDTVVSERGLTLSGGQRQRLAIARALLRRPRLLLLDEATASLDPQSEQDICLTVKKFTEGMTVIAVSHQTAIINIADEVYRVADGSISPGTIPMRAAVG